MHRVVITGIGIISCIENNTDAVSRALRRGDSGVVVDEMRVKMGFRSPLTGRIKGFDSKLLTSIKDDRVP